MLCTFHPEPRDVQAQVLDLLDVSAGFTSRPASTDRPHKPLEALREVRKRAMTPQFLSKQGARHRVSRLSTATVPRTRSPVTFAPAGTRA